MVGIFSRFSGYISKAPHHQPSHKLVKLEQVGEAEEEDGSRGSDDARCAVVLEGEEEEEAGGGEFMPIRHPLEPLDDDRPAEYPLPFSRLDGGEPSDTFAKSLRRKMAAESKTESEDGGATQTPKRRSHSLPPSSHNIFQVFHQCKQLA